MNAVDTNVLARYIVRDDARDAAAATTLIEQEFSADNPAIVTQIVLCELVWVLRGAYRFNRSPIVTALDKILSTALFSFEDRDLLRQALDEYRDGDGDLADYVIGARNARSGCEVTVTFDRGLRGSERFSLLQSATS